MEPTESKVKIKKLLLDLESPFSWKIPEMDLPADQFITTQTEKCDNLDEETEFKWTSFILHIVLAFELRQKKKYSKAIEHIDACIKHLEALDEGHCKDPLYVNIRRALWHVALATHGHLLLKKFGPISTLDSVISRITPVSKMESRERAGMYGIKAAFFIQYGLEGHRLALQHARTARGLDPGQAEWSFLVGSAIGRIRRLEYTTITPEELDVIEKAYTFQRTAAYTAYLAQIYGEYSRQLFYGAKGSMDVLQKSKQYSKKSIDCFKKALEIRPNCPNLGARVAHGLIRANDKDAKDIRYTKDLLDRVLSMTPNNAMVYHDLGLYYEKFEGNTEKSLQNLQKSSELGNIKALLYMTVVKWNHGKKNEIIDDLKKGLEQYKGKDRRAELLTCLGAAYLLVKDDWPSGVKYLVESLKVDSSAKFLERYCGFKGKKTNLLQLVADELRLKYGNSSTPVYAEYFTMIRTLKPEILKNDPKYGAFEAWKSEQLNAGRQRQASANFPRAVSRQQHRPRPRPQRTPQLEGSRQNSLSTSKTTGRTLWNNTSREKYNNDFSLWGYGD